MARAVAARGVNLRPHIKTHKSVALAQIQVAAGAVGVTVGTLGEAEVMAEGGISDIFLAYPLWAEGAKVGRLRALHERVGRAFSVGVDSVASGRQLVSAVAGTHEPLRVLIELDPGNHRTGTDPTLAGELGSELQALGLDVIGAFAHGGHAYRGREIVAEAAADEIAAISTAAEALRVGGRDAQTRSAGATAPARG